MHFIGISESLFTTLLASLGGAIVLLYLVKLRRRRIQVPYSAIWASVLDERRAKGLWQRLKRWLSLILQLVILGLLLLALRDPQPRDQDLEQRHVMLVVDTSASMAAVDMPGGRDRMEAAREQALAAFDDLGPSDQLMVVRMEGQPRPLTSFSRPSAATRELLRDLDYTATSADLAATLQFAGRSLAGRSRAELLIITDAAWRPSDLEHAAEVELPAGVQTHVVQVGEATGNVAVAAFNVRRYPANRLNYEVYLRLESTFDVPLTVEVTIAANEREVERMLVDLGAGESQVRVYPNLATGGQRLEARIEIVSGNAIDQFPLDDVAFALLPEDRRTRVLLVASDNLFVEAPLLMNQNIEVTKMAPSTYLARAEEAGPEGHPSAPYDVTVFQGVTPAPPERGGFLYIHPEGEYSPWAVSGQRTDPIIHRFERDDPLMRWITELRSLNIARAQRLTLGDNDTRVAWSIRGDPIFVRREETGRRLVGLAFRIEESDFALRISYPLFVLNAIDWLAAAESGVMPSYTTGRAWRIEPDEPSAGAWVLPPVGPPQWRALTDGGLTLFPEHPGFYAVTWSAGPDADPPGRGLAAADRILPANLFDAGESDIAPAQELPFEVRSESPDLQESALLGAAEPWLYLLLLALGLLCLEWMTFNRRITV